MAQHGRRYPRLSTCLLLFTAAIVFSGARTRLSFFSPMSANTLARMA